jgi:ribosomal protein RSM22 (predicted rRNA methylase)
VRILLIETLWSKLKEGGIIILVENGSPKGSRFAHDFRSFLLSKKEARVIAPCPH